MGKFTKKHNRLVIDVKTGHFRVLRQHWAWAHSMSTAVYLGKGLDGSPFSGALTWIPDSETQTAERIQGEARVLIELTVGGVCDHSIIPPSSLGTSMHAVGAQVKCREERSRDPQKE